MKTTATDIVMIPIAEIVPNPYNPRKNVGDIAELTESVQKNGILQNLTVINGHYTETNDFTDGGYTVLVGHRRLAAAKAAGLTEVPCRIADGIDEKDQVSLMLEENMQRDNLTICEQAQGFQMVLDLGGTEDSIVEKTGFSKSTVKRRLNIAKLNQEVLAEKQESDGFQLNLTDLYALEKIKDVDKRNEILANASNSNEIKTRANVFLAEEARKERLEKLITIFEEKGIKKAPESAANNIYSNKWDRVHQIDLNEEIGKSTIPEEIEDGLMWVQVWRSVFLIRKSRKKDKVLTAEELARAAKDENKKKINARMKEMDAYRTEFVANVIKNNIRPDTVRDQDICMSIWDVITRGNEGCHISELAYESFFTKTAKAEEDKATEHVQEKIAGLSWMAKMLIALNKTMSERKIVDWRLNYSEKSGADLLDGYRILEEFGWVYENEDDIELLNGTHELFTVGEKPDEESGETCEKVNA